MINKLINKFSGRFLSFSIIAFFSIFFSGCYNKKADLIVPNNNCDTSVTISYSADVSNILSQNCYVCHGADKYSTSGGGNQLDTYLSLQRKVMSGELLKAINHDPEVVPMPLSGGKLSDCDIMKITAWVNRGAPNN